MKYLKFVMEDVLIGFAVVMFLNSMIYLLKFAKGI